VLECLLASTTIGLLVNQLCIAEVIAAVTVAGHPWEEVPVGTLKNIMKQAGIEK
jgi:hypothetical protein